jgi:hypothetical protein
MLSRRTRLLTFAVPVAASLALAGPAFAADAKGDKAILKAGVITTADVPADWTSTRGETGVSALRGVKGCKRTSNALARASKDEPQARSRLFSDAADRQARTQAANNVFALSTSKAAGKFLSVFQRPAATSCFEALGVAVTTNQPTAGPPTVQPITDLQGVGDEAFGSEVAATYTQDGGTATLYIDYVFVRVGRAALTFVFANVGSRIPQGPDIVNAVVQRVSAAEA